ncbi:DUF6763 family protein [Methylococcus sp. EFPC2]|uniref:DUF6763 family protein n=1 Tax=Methylococcus sp. EFPC2 TaxID=2812648 RepID=UPI0019689C55|nr:DUF6763 family protein [Methylococcus sp. EFPC2]QSA98003.1 hypothetical protein JWZ97_04010 [Methylococcus sp. EFPC2]
MNAIDPILDNWYEDAASGRTFRVVALDEANETIEVQYLNGDLGEYDCASWNESAIVLVEAPEDWSAPFDDVETDDLGYSDPDTHGRDIGDITLNDLLEGEE